jgi:hydrophobic/amphiphilic exporter-1 (mainly G- bacteria), HAE1 family
MLSKFFINRPIVAMVISILMVLVGVVALVQLPVAQYPEVVPTEIQVRSSFPGADAKTLEESVATPIESQVVGVDNMNYMTSTNTSAGASNLTVSFDVKTDPNVDQMLTQLRVDQASNRLPPEVINAGVVTQKSASTMLMFIAMRSPKGTYNTSFLSNYAYINLVDELSRIEGVGRIQVFGAGQYAMRIWVKPDMLAKTGITVPNVIAAVKAQNAVNAAGRIGAEPVPSGQEYTYTMRALGRLSTPEEFGEIVLRANPDGSLLRLKDVANIELGAQSYSSYARLNSEPAALMGVYQMPGTNSVATVQRVRAKLAELSQRFPNDIEYQIPLDTTKAVTAGIHEIELTVLVSLALVILVVYLFLQGWRATLIPLLAVPVSLIGTFVVFPLLGFSINTLSLFGLVLAIGLVVDDAIVVVEAVERHIEEGMAPKAASIRAMEEVSGPVIAIAMILAAVFIPTAFIPGITGRLYQQFAVTTSISVIFSAFNALTLSPALCALLLHPRKHTRGPLGRFFAWFNRGFARATNGYVAFSGLMIRKTAASLLILVVLAVAGIRMGQKLPRSFLPQEDLGYLYVNLQLPQAASLQRTLEAVQQGEKIVSETPGVKDAVSVVGVSILSSTENTYSAFMNVALKDWSERTAPEQKAEAIQAILNKKLSVIPDATAFVFSPPAIPGVGNAGGVTMMLEDRAGKGGDYLNQNLEKFLAALRARPEIDRAITTYAPHVPQYYVEVDREKVLRQKVNLSEVYQTMQTYMGSYLVNYFNRFGRQWQVYVAAAGDYRTTPDAIGQYFVTNANGEMVPLSSLTSVRSVSGPEFVVRHNEYEAAQINITAKTGYSSGQVTAALKEVFDETMPREMGYDFTGMSYQEQLAEKGVSATTVFGLSLLFVFLILAALYESWSLPFSVLLSTPIAVFGAFTALRVRGLENNVYAQIGLVMLIGLAAKNAILIVEFAKREYEGGKTLMDAALHGARLRLRPILMTSFAFILGCVPLWLASGAGAASRRILGTAVIGGMLSATLIAVFLVPVSFASVERLFRHHPRKAAKPVPEPDAIEAADAD